MFLRWSRDLRYTSHPRCAYGGKDDAEGIVQWRGESGWSGSTTEPNRILDCL